MITSEQFNKAKEILFTSTDPLYTLDALHTLLDDYSSRKTSDELDQILLENAIKLIRLKIQIYKEYPFYADNILKQYHDQSNN